MKTKVRWGILGAGKIAEQFAAALNYTEGAEIRAVASRERPKGKAFADTYKAGVQYDRYEDLVKDPAVDIVYIATPHSFHYDHTLLCLDHDKAGLCEKPMSLNYSQTHAMVQA